ncbi:CRISPR-associated endonuclease Cas2 [archaeon]|nr:CRISPR-associated endonuclease Cas2 [Acholeplasmataceae bacterium]MCK9293264.1 CRISPR-associated endonuclease Cas2 [archaeon]MCK9439453.1 CRISPR-associated endonuclease Cas2 [Patescibacteria group bacterium]
MLVLISYDISNSAKRSKVLNNVYKICKRYLYQIQYSVFIGELTKPLFNELIIKLKNETDEKLDSLLIIKIKNKHNAKTEYYGNKQFLDNIIC